MAIAKDHRTHVFLDTWVFNTELMDFSSRHIEVIRSLAQDGSIHVILTDVTVKEVESQIQEMISTAVGALKSFPKSREDRSVGVLRHLGGKFECIFQKHDRDELAKELSGHFRKFLEDTRATVISSRTVQAGPIIDAYFEKKPPFSEGKKDEFPDAIAAAALASWTKETGNKLNVVSGDGDWLNLCDAEGFLHHATLVPVFAQFPDPFLVRHFIAAIKCDQYLKKSLVRQFEDRTFVVTGGDGEVTDVDDVEIELLEPCIIEIKDGMATFDADCDVSFVANVIYEIPVIRHIGREEWYDDVEKVREAIPKSITRTVTIEVEYEEGKTAMEELSISGNFSNTDIEVDISDLLREYFYP